jgi:quercetin dioxygenase-like cupin family protein
MTVSGIQVIKPEIALTTDVEEAIIDKISDGSTDTRGLNVSVVRFPRGVRRPWSAHTQDQYAWIISGSRIIASEGTEIRLSPKTLVFIPANTMHQHGASDEEGMTQLLIIGGEKPRETSL